MYVTMAELPPLVRLLALAIGVAAGVCTTPERARAVRAGVPLDPSRYSETTDGKIYYFALGPVVFAMLTAAGATITRVHSN